MISQDYLRTLKHEHSLHPWGYWGYELAPAIRKFAEEHQIQSVLDYGCGSNHGVRMWAEKNQWQIDLREYDPAVPGSDQKPRRAELVVCIDVMEHVEEQYVNEVMDHILSVSGRYTWFTISMKPAERRLKLTGQNAHVTLHQADWWLERLRERWQPDYVDYNSDWLRFRGVPVQSQRSLRLQRLQQFVNRVSR